MTEAVTAGPAARLLALDVIRGVAVMGILLLNIVDFAMPSYAYVDPTFYGGAEGANWWAWAINFVLADGKMRGLFTMLFGASTMLIAERALTAGKSPARVHYARMISLFGIGMVHAYLIWSGDILVLYALCGALVFVAWRWRTSTLIATAAILMLGQLGAGIADHAAARRFEAKATAPNAPPALSEQWRQYREARDESRAQIPAELAAFRGGWRDVLPARFALTVKAQTEVMPGIIPETLALMLLGMALFRSGFFSGLWETRPYRQVILLGYGVCLPLYLPLAWWISATGFDPVTLLVTDPLHLVLLRPWVALAHAAAVILLLRSYPRHWLADRLAAAGRMAFSNYLATSIVCTYLFCGYGLGWFGHVQRWQLYAIVFALWALMLAWSKPWLDRFAYGPFEWLWRSLAQLRLQPLRRAVLNDPCESDAKHLRPVLISCSSGPSRGNAHGRVRLQCHPGKPGS